MSSSSYPHCVLALPGMGEDRGYNRPWTANMKKSKGSMEQDDQAGEMLTLKEKNVDIVLNGDKVLKKIANLTCRYKDIHLFIVENWMCHLLVLM